MPKRRLLLAAVGALVAVAAAVPVIAYVIVPAFVRSTVYEPPPSPAAVASIEVSAPGAPSPAPVAALRGELRRIDTVHYGRGHIIVEGGNLRFEDVEIAAAPNMYVYLSDRDDGSPGHFVDLGPLRATNGSFNYGLPEGVALGSIRSVVVWCRAFSVTVTYAVLAGSS